MTPLDEVRAAREAADKTRREFKAAQARYRTTQQAKTDTYNQLRRACIEAITARIPYRQIFLASGVSRNTLYQWAAETRATTRAEAQAD